MATIDNVLFERAGATGSGNSDYSLARTSCCAAWVVVDDELHILYVDPGDLSNHSFEFELAACPLCGVPDWSYEATATWPKQPNPWQWAFHSDPEVVAAWQRSK